MRALLPKSGLVAILGFAIGCLTASAANLPPAAPDPACHYEVRLEGYLSDLAALDTAPANMTAVRETAALGRVLFFDHSLSKNGLVACSSCHSREAGFDDPTRFSIGFEGRITRRSAMALANSRFNPGGRFFRDLRAPGLEAQVLEPFSDPIEMGLQPGELEARVTAAPWYRALFTAAFGDPDITQQRIAIALAQYVRAIVTFDTRYDREREKADNALADFAGFSTSENRGKRLFMTARNDGGAGCSACHEGEAFILSEPRDNGLAVDPQRPDQGVGEITGKREDLGKFRTASLRNIAVSAPYMHDGRFRTLEEVIDHYSDGIVAKPNLAPELRDVGGNPVRLNLSWTQKRDLVAFLQTLTDWNAMRDPCLSDPFRR
ncbi:MAG: cytochrome c peroxidase [Nitratireductor sp.]